MKYLLIVIPLLLAGCKPAAAQSTPPMEVFFSPKGGCTEAIVKEIGGATKSVYVQAYGFTNAAIAKAVVEARKRGLAVEVILDKSNTHANYSEADFFLHEGVATLIDAAHAIAHNKVMIIDGATVITGSFNFTKAAEERNAENLLIVHDAELAKKYLKNYEAHKRHSTEYKGKT